MKKRKTVITLRRQAGAAGLSTHTFCIPVINFFLLLIIGFLPVIPLNANASDPGKGEDTYALIFGTVWRPDNRPVYGVRVAIRRAEDKKARWHLVSDHSGEFAQRVPAGKGDYFIWAESVPGKKANSHKNSNLGEGSGVKLHIENDERADISLHLTE